MIKCKICNKKEGTITYSESVLHYTHGMRTMICKECYIQLLKDKKIDIEQEIKELKRSY